MICFYNLTGFLQNEGVCDIEWFPKTCYIVDGVSGEVYAEGDKKTCFLWLGIIVEECPALDE